MSKEKKKWEPSGNKSSEQKIRCGQSLNLAIAISIADNKQHDNEHIIKQYLRMYEFSSLLQRTTPENLTTVLKDPKIVKIIKELDRELQGK